MWFWFLWFGDNEIFVHQKNYNLNLFIGTFQFSSLKQKHTSTIIVYFPQAFVSETVWPSGSREGGRQFMHRSFSIYREKMRP
jgi:hypothetical protein